MNLLDHIEWRKNQSSILFYQKRFSSVPFCLTSSYLQRSLFYVETPKCLTSQSVEILSHNNQNKIFRGFYEQGSKSLKIVILIM